MVLVTPSSCMVSAPPAVPLTRKMSSVPGASWDTWSTLKLLIAGADCASAAVARKKDKKAATKAIQELRIVMCMLHKPEKPALCLS